MIDPASGELRFDDGFVISPQRSLAGFLSLVTGATADITAQPPWSSFRVPPRRMDASWFASQLLFRGEALSSVSVWRSDPGAKQKSWDGWTMEGEAAEQQWNEAWLARSLGPPHESHPWGAYPDRQVYRFAWGTIESAFSPQTGATSLSISYNAVA